MNLKASVLIGLFSAASIGFAWAQAPYDEDDEDAPLPAKKQNAPAPAPAPAPAKAEAPAPAKAEAKKSDTVTININTSGARSAAVYFGKKKLGVTPLEFTWPRNSGPLDLAVKAGGYFTVYTRVYTFDDEKITVKMTPLDQAHTLFGYKAKLDSSSSN